MMLAVRSCLVSYLITFRFVCPCYRVRTCFLDQLLRLAAQAVYFVADSWFESSTESRCSLEASYITWYQTTGYLCPFSDKRGQHVWMGGESAPPCKHLWRKSNRCRQIWHSSRSLACFTDWVHTLEIKMKLLDFSLSPHCNNGCTNGAI